MYFDQNNNYFDDYYNINNINDYSINIDNINFNRGNDLYSVEDGFNKGNMFKDLYSKYKNHVYKLKINNQKDELLYKVQMYTFALKDLSLYLDTHPTDQSVLLEFQKIKKLLDNEKTKYEKVYGVLCVNEVTSDDKWTWINNPWPWDKGGK